MVAVRLDFVDPTLGDLVLEVLDLPFQLVFSVDLGFDETLELFVEGGEGEREGQRVRFEEETIQRGWRERIRTSWTSRRFF